MTRLRITTLKSIRSLLNRLRISDSDNGKKTPKEVKMISHLH